MKKSLSLILYPMRSLLRRVFGFVPKEGVEDGADRKKEEVYKQLKIILTESLEYYNQAACPCAFPRFHQIVSIDCTDYSRSFMCFETELLISLSKPYFDIFESNYKDEVCNEKWVCKACGSEYEYGYSDFSIYVARQKLTLVILKANIQGQPPTFPVPVCMGLEGHSFPIVELVRKINLQAFKQYMAA